MNQSEKPYIIVVGVDLSEESNLALDQAITIAGRTARSELHVVHVVSTVLPGPSVDYPAVAPVSLAAAGERLREHVDRRLAEHEAELSAPNGRRPERVVCHIRLDAASEEIAQLAADLEADLVVAGPLDAPGPEPRSLAPSPKGAGAARPVPASVFAP